MRSKRVQFLFVLAAMIAAIQLLEIFALLALPRVVQGNAPSAIPFDGMSITFAVLGMSVPTIVPFFLFAFAGLMVFREFYWALWCLVVCAMLYALFVSLGLLVEYGMAKAAMEAAAQGKRYMNCGGHPRLFFLLFGMPLSGGTMVVSASVLMVESAIRSVLARPNREGFGGNSEHTNVTI